MADNFQRGGLRWVRSKYTPGDAPPIELGVVATAYGTKINTGDIVKLLNDGTFAAAVAGDTAYGICDGCQQYYDGTAIRSGAALPASTSWGTVWERRSLIRVIPGRGQIFRMCADDKTTFTTPATYLAAVGENCEWIAGTASGDQSGTLLDISTHATTNTLSLNIQGFPDQSITDFSGLYVPVEVTFNLIQDQASGSTTGT